MYIHDKQFGFKTPMVPGEVWQVKVGFLPYVANPDVLAIQLIDADNGEPIARCTVNIPELVACHILGHYWVAIKTWN